MDSYKKFIKYKTKNLSLINQLGGEKKLLTNDVLKLVPKMSTAKNYIDLTFPDIKVSQCEYSEGPVGLTYIHFDKGARTYMEIRGGWPAYTNMLSTNEKQMISGINISGGSILGLESTSGLVAESFKQEEYKDFKGINGSIIYSSNLWKNKIYPDKALGRFAYNNFSKKLYNGQAGAGRSAAHGQGWAYKEIDDAKILVLCVNNAIGSVYKDNEPIHHPHNAKKFYIENVKLGKNTTIICLITNINLDNDELKQLNHQANVSIGENIRPFNTFADGDVFYTCSTKKIRNKFNRTQLIKFFDVCSSVLQEAILNSIL